MKTLTAFAVLALASCGAPLSMKYSTLDDDGNRITGQYSSKAGLAVEYHSK